MSDDGPDHGHETDHGHGDDEFDREMHEADWAAVYDRQAARGGLVDDLCDVLGLGAGDAVLEVGCGPGYTSLRLAGRVGPGRVYAVDRQPAALRYLLATAAGATHALPPADGDPAPVCPVVGDAESLPVCFDRPTAALAAFVLHHVEAPASAVASVAESLPAGSRFLVAEYHPDAAGEVGPPTDHRIRPDRVHSWLEAAGFTVETDHSLPEEAYAVLARR
jgi:ubiquinone/menaquinone biosynthesis C-methylase UbiE